MDYESDFADEFAETSLGDMHFKHHKGNGEKMIFIHGLGGSTLVWKRLMEHMPDDLDIYLIDMLGHGQSAAPDIDYTVSAQFQFLREFIALQNNGDSIIIGHSYGGWVAAYYASQPCGLKGVVLEDTAGIKEQFDDLSSSGKLQADRERLMSSVMELNENKESIMRSIIFSDHSSEDIEDGMIADIKKPVRLIWGRDDATVPLSYGILLGKKMNAEIDIIEGAGHEPHFEQPEKVKEAIMDFVSKVASQPR
jgi:2-succinyl-6-hydroxy-2,4-cyclohexadiene-1-carboxylate synthase